MVFKNGSQTNQLFLKILDLIDDLINDMSEFEKVMVAICIRNKFKQKTNGNLFHNKKYREIGAEYWINKLVDLSLKLNKPVNGPDFNNNITLNGEIKGAFIIQGKQDGLFNTNSKVGFDKQRNSNRRKETLEYKSFVTVLEDKEAIKNSPLRFIIYHNTEKETSEYRRLLEQKQIEKLGKDKIDIKNFGEVKGWDDIKISVAELFKIVSETDNYIIDCWKKKLISKKELKSYFRGN